MNLVHNQCRRLSECNFASFVKAMSCCSLSLLLGLVGVCIFVYLLQSKRGSNNKLPPGPRGLPIIGSLHLLGHLPHRALHRLSNKYGPIMFMKLGQIPTIVVSSPEATQQFLKNHDLIFASRPMTEIGRLISNDYKGLSFTPYGVYWRNVRKFCTIVLLSNLKIESFKPMRREEMGLMVQSLKEASQAHVPINLTMKLAGLSRDMTCRMVLGKKYMEDKLGEGGFQAVLEEIMPLAAALNIAEYIPWTRRLDLQGINRRITAISDAFDKFFEEIIDEHVQSKAKREQQDFVDFMLSFMESDDNEFHIGRSNIKAIMLDMLVAAMDTSPTVVEWAMLELIKHPRVMKKAQEELETVVGKERMVDESDLPNLNYLDMVVKETMRLHPVVPLLLPHESMEDCIINGFNIPKGTRLIINTWAIGRDPKTWSNPEEFYPERFIDTNIHVGGQNYQLLPFGSGRRRCPGIQLATTVVPLVLGQLIHCFDWEPLNGISPPDLDMSEKFGIVMRMENNLHVIPAYRLREENST